MTRRWPLFFLSFVLLAVPLRPQDTEYAPQGGQIPGPHNATEAADHCCARTGQAPVSVSAWQAWLADLQHYRRERLIRAGYHSEQYDRAELKWTQKAFIQPQMMIEDRYFYDPAAGKYTVDRYLDDLEKRYGGIDAVLIWHTYTNIGVDSRNQYDLLGDMPGGVAGVRQMIADFHRRGVRVLFPVMLWDRGTRDEGAPNWVATARLLAEVGADGVNGDTLAELPLAFREASDATGHPLAFEPEGAPENPAEALAWNNMSWGYWKYPFEPMVGLYKWLEPRHLAHVCDRWARDKTDNLQYAFFNGAGYESWENIWGIWNQIDDRDAEGLGASEPGEQLLLGRDAPLVRLPLDRRHLGAVPEDRWGRIHRAGAGVPVPSLPGAWEEFYAGLARALHGDKMDPGGNGKRCRLVGAGMHVDRIAGARPEQRRVQALARFHADLARLGAGAGGEGGQEQDGRQANV